MSRFPLLDVYTGIGTQSCSSIQDGRRDVPIPHRYCDHDSVYHIFTCLLFSRMITDSSNGFYGANARKIKLLYSRKIVIFIAVKSFVIYMHIRCNVCVDVRLPTFPRRAPISSLYAGNGFYTTFMPRLS